MLDLHIGDRVRLVAYVERGEGMAVQPPPEGLFGSVAVWERGLVCVRFDEILPGFEHYHNEVQWGDADDPEGADARAGASVDLRYVIEPPRYWSQDGDEIDLDAAVKDGNLTPGDVETIRALGDGEAIQLGGGGFAAVARCDGGQPDDSREPPREGPDLVAELYRMMEAFEDGYIGRLLKAAADRLGALGDG